MDTPREALLQTACAWSQQRAARMRALLLQNHSLRTGALYESLAPEAELQGSTLTAGARMREYGLFVDAGLGRGRGPTYDGKSLFAARPGRRPFFSPEWGQGRRVLLFRLHLALRAQLQQRLQALQLPPVQMDL